MCAPFAPHRGLPATATNPRINERQETHELPTDRNSDSDLLVAAAVTTIAIAWLLAAFLITDQPSVPGKGIFGSPSMYPLDPRERYRWQSLREQGIDVPGILEVNRWDRFGSTILHVSIGSFRHRPLDPPSEMPVLELVPDWASSQITRVLPDDDDADIYSIEARGWPFRALWCRPGEFHSATQSVFGATPANELEAHGGIVLEKSNINTHSLRTLPLIPIWPGFAIDTLIYAIMWFALLTITGSARARIRIRIRRGRCPRCKYDLRANSTPGCPECGWKRE